MAVQQPQGPLSLGFIGGGAPSASGQIHYAACRLDGRWSLDAGAFDRDPQRNAQTGRERHIPADRLYASWRDMLLAERARLDAIVVLGPAPQHYEITQALLKAGIPVICEAPLATGLSDARALLARYRPTEQFAAVAFPHSGHAMLRELRQRMRDGRFGRVHQLHIELPQQALDGGAAAATTDWRSQDGFIPAVCLDLGVQLHHLAGFLSGEEPEGVNAEFRHCAHGHNVVDNVSLWLEYASGMTASLWMSRTAVGRRDGLRIRVFGELGSAEWHAAQPDRLHIATADGMRTIIDRASPALLAGEDRYRRFGAASPGGAVEALANLYTDLADALLAWRDRRRHDNPYVFGLEHAANGLALFHAARLSSSRRRWERIKATGSRPLLGGAEAGPARGLPGALPRSHSV
jgi:predicted dehydrogenase